MKLFDLQGNKNGNQATIGFTYSTEKQTTVI